MRYSLIGSGAAIVVVLSATIFAEEKRDSVAEQYKPFAERRAALMEALGHGVAVLYSQGRDADTGYRADANFWYLTGVDERGAILVLAPREADRQILLLPPRDVEAERWTGRRPPLTERLERQLGFDRILRTQMGSRSSLDRVLLSHMRRARVLHLISTPVGPSQDVPPDMRLYRKICERVPEVTIRNSSSLLEGMRMVKSSSEIAAIERAIDVTHHGITDVLAGLRSGMTEFQLDGVLENSFKRQGSQFMAFPPIIGSGAETCILHYEARNRAVASGQLLLLDVGAEWGRYAADITRTVPVDGRFSEEQARVYDVVLAAQQAAIEAVKPGATFREIDGRARDIIRRAGYIDFFLHGTSHYLGLDVHDVGDRQGPLKPGMVLTVEPGVYLPDKRIGVRIEDDVLVTRDGCRVLSHAIPRQRKDVEAWIDKAQRRRSVQGR
jgi:Xaa-Pro aminopeptidase